MVSRSYMSLEARPPSAAKTTFDQKIVPILIDAAGAFESMLARLAVHTRRSPALALAAAFGLGLALPSVLLRRR